MNLRNALIIVANRYCEGSGLSRGRVSTIVLNSGTALDRIEAGANFTNKSYERALNYFSENWPNDAVWPENIMRPPNFVGTEVSA